MMLRCFQNGADGVMVLGCHIGDCHYQAGNRRAEKRVNDVKEMLKGMGISEDRLLLKWISASEGGLFAQTCREFVDAMTALGPLEEGSL